MLFGLLVLSGANGRAEPGYLRFPALRGEAVVFTAEGDLWRGTIHGGPAQRLTTHPAGETHAAISPDGQTVAFTASYEGASDVYTMPLAGGLPVRRTLGGGTVIGWSPEGRIIYSVRRYSTLPSVQLATMDLAVGEPKLLPLAQASDGAIGDEGVVFFTRLPFQGSSTKRYKGGTAQNLWRFREGDAEATPLTPDFTGTSKNPMWWRGRVYFLTDRDGTMNIWSMRPDGTDLQQHTRHSGWDVKNASLSEGRIAYSIGAGLRLLEIEGGQDRALSFQLPSDLDQQREKWVKKPIEYLTSAHLSPTGDRVALTARGQVFVAPLKPGRFVDVTRNPKVRYREARFLNGTNLVALGDASGELDFWTLPANGVGQPAQVTANATAFRFEGIPSADGRWLAYQDKNLDLFVWDFENKKEIAVTNSPNGFGELVWSPDSQWLAYVRGADNGFSQIHLFHPAEGTRFELTNDRVESYSPAWSPDGKWLYFLSDRELRSLVPSPWGPRQPEPFFDQVTRIYQVALQKELRSPFAAPDELEAANKDEKKEEKKEEKKAKKDDSASESSEKKESDSDKKEKEKEQEKEKKKVRIDFEGLAARVYEVPVRAGNYGGLMATAKHLYWGSRETSFEGRVHLQQMEITRDDPKPKQFVEDVRDYELSGDGQKLLIRKGDNLYIVNADSGAPADLRDDRRINLGDWGFSIDPRDEWRQMFTESWRLMRDYFYDRGMHGVDWKAMLEKYRPLVDRVTDRAELSDLMADLMGELSALHTVVRGGDHRPPPDDIGLATLGAELARDQASGNWRVTHIYRTDPNYPGELSPLARPECPISEGDLLVSFNGVPLATTPNPELLLRRRAGQQVLVEFQKAGREDRQQTIVRPISLSAAFDLRYDEWEYTRRREVERLAGGGIGYVHLRAMGARNIAEWARDYFPVHRKSGLIIDVRNNTGGNIDSWILGKLLRKAWFYWQGRAGHQTWNMHYAFRGHLVVLCNEHTASDGEAFSEGFKRLGLGKVIGTRTWGGEIWLTGSNGLVDRGVATAAEFGVYGPEGEWLIEGHGVDPDIVVDNLPHATFKGQDAQLEAAVKHLQELIKNDPRPVPPVPRHPDKSFKPPTAR